jgi:penicillin-binding protein A
MSSQTLLSALVDRPSGQRRGSTRSRTRTRRLVALAVVGVAALAAGMVTGASSESAQTRVAESFTAAWARSDYAAMHALLSRTAQRRTSLRRLTRAYRRADVTATVERVGVRTPRRVSDGAYRVPVSMQTRIFGRVNGNVRLPVVTEGDRSGVDWRSAMVFPGLRTGERLERKTRLPARGTLQARDGTVIAEGEERTSELDPAAAVVKGTVGKAPAARARELAAQGVPAGSPVGLTGLEREFDTTLLGTPGGTLHAGDRLLARSRPEKAEPVRTTVDPRVQKAAVGALGDRYGGIAVLRPTDGEVLALAGIGYSAPQPPGSTFKIVTLAGALQARVVRPSSRFGVETSTTLEGVELQNANGEACGGTLEESFAASCNSVFAPLGAKLGARRLVTTAERFGFNQDPSLKGAARSTIPPAEEIGDALAVGSTAIGQGQVLATPLEMATVAAAIGQHGRRRVPTLRKGEATPTSRATTPGVARTVRRYMESVVASGTGMGAKLSGARVAGKTGTAELRATVPTTPPSEDPTQPVPADDKSDTDAWFVGFAPASRPRVAVAVLLVGEGAGGESAAPAAKPVLQAALG